MSKRAFKRGPIVFVIVALAAAADGCAVEDSDGNGQLVEVVEMEGMVVEVDYQSLEDRFVRSELALSERYCDSDPEEPYRHDLDCLRRHGDRVRGCYQRFYLCRRAGDDPDGLCLRARDACVDRSRREFMGCLDEREGR